MATFWATILGPGFAGLRFGVACLLECLRLSLLCSFSILEAVGLGTEGLRASVGVGMIGKLNRLEMEGC